MLEDQETGHHTMFSICWAFLDRGIEEGPSGAEDAIRVTESAVITS